MTKKSKKLKWERVSGTFDLKVINVSEINSTNLRKLLKKVEADYSDYKKPFSKDASKYLREWLDQPGQVLKEAAYCLLSNWFLTECSASKSTRAFHAVNLWDALFCIRPDGRLTDWRISGRKVIPYKFRQWWKKQQKCQEDC